MKELQKINISNMIYEVIEKYYIILRFQFETLELKQGVAMHM